jgi:hypothetical protein
MWCACHGVPPFSRLGDPRSRELDERQQHHAHDRDGERRVGDQQRHPAGLGDQDRLDVRHARRASVGIMARGAPPLDDHRHPHDHVAGDHHAVVDRSAFVDRLEHLGQPEGEHDHADHLHHRGQAVDPVVGVVGRCEPREVDPRPVDREGGEREPEQARLDVVLGEEVGQLVGRDPERDHEREVEQQLERRRRPVRLPGVTPPMRARR